MKKDRRNKRNSIRHILATILFCMVISVGTVCLAVEGTVNRDSVIRKTADPNSEKIGSAANGKKIDIISQTTGADGKKWYQVYKNSNEKGFIRADLVTVTGNETIPTTSQTTTSTTTTTTNTTNTGNGTVTPIEARRGMIKVDSTNIRTSASASSAKKGTVNKGTIVTVTGETTGSDGKKWYQVSLAYNNEEIVGFVRNDLITFDNVPPEEEISEITGNTGSEEAPQDPSAETPPEQTEQPEQTPEIPVTVAATDNKQNVTLMNPEEDPPYVMPGFEEKTMDWIDGQKYKIYLNGKFFICYGRRQNGEEGWLLYDIDGDIFQRYAYSSEGATIPGMSIGLIPAIILIALIIILAAVVGLLALRLRDYKGDDEYDDDDEEDDDEEEDLEDIEEDDDEEEERPARRTQIPRQNGRTQRQPIQQPAMRRTPSEASQPSPQGVRRTQPGAPQAGPQGVRRTQSGAPQPSPQGTRRVQPGASQPSPQGTRRVPPSTGNEGTGRPQGARPSNGQQVSSQAQGRQRTVNERQPSPQGTKPTQYQNVGGQPQRGYRTKNTSENEEDMDFMDI